MRGYWRGLLTGATLGYLAALWWGPGPTAGGLPARRLGGAGGRALRLRPGRARRRRRSVTLVERSAEQA